ncbi:MAG: prepilin peptidase [Pirellulales bacterium]
MNVSQALWGAIDPHDSLTVIQFIIWWLLVLWLLAVGGCFGSFMNVVIYRLPAGLSVLKPASRCPYCLHRIRGRDNIPVLSWLLLRGRCRDCGVPVSPRYPLLEGLIAASCLILAVSEVFPGVDGLPPAVQQDLLANPWQLWTMFTAHLLLICTLVCAVMIQLDGHAIPLRLFVPIALVSLGMATLVPEACRIRWSISPPGTWAGNSIQAMMAAGCGAFAGATLALFTRESARFSRGTLGLSLSLAIISLFIGWISGLIVTVTCGLLAWIQGRLARRYRSWEQLPTLAWVTTVTFVLLIAWRWLLPHFPVLALDSASSFAVATIVATLLLSATAWWLGPWSPLAWTDENEPEPGDAPRDAASAAATGATGTVPDDADTLDVVASPSLAPRPPDLQSDKVSL